MQHLQIITEPDDRLRQKSRPVQMDEFGPKLFEYMEALIATMSDDGVGLAAVQVGDPRRIVVVQPDKDGPVYKMVNPWIAARSSETEVGDEGCLSVPGLVLQVSRSSWVIVHWEGPTGFAHERRFEGWDARVVQHELDHLEGLTLYNQSTRQVRRRYDRRGR